MNAGPAADLVPVTPSDDTELTSVRGLYVSVTGTLVIDTINRTNVDLGSPAAGTTIPIMATKVKAATSATVLALKG